MQEPILPQAHYENVPLYSLRELEELSKREADEAWERAEKAEQRLAEARKLGQEIESFINFMTAKYANKN